MTCDGTDDVLVGAESDDRAGSAVDSAGDLDGDGVSDVLVGAPGSDIGGNDSGAAYALFSECDTEPKTETATVTDTPTETPTDTPTETPTETPTDTPTDTPTETETSEDDIDNDDVEIVFRGCGKVTVALDAAVETPFEVSVGGGKLVSFGVGDGELVENPNRCADAGGGQPGDDGRDDEAEEEV